MNMKQRPMIAALVLSLLFVGASDAGAVEMAVTVDDLPTTGSAPKGADRRDIAKRIIATLHKHGVKQAYGFVNAKQIADEPSHERIVMDWVEGGFPIGNHTWAHSNLERVSVEEFVEDVRKNEPVLRRLAKGGNFKFFRYPYLREGKAIERHRAVRKALRDDGYTIAPVTTYFDDWAWNEAYVRCADLGRPVEIAALERSYLDAAAKQFEWVDALSRKVERRPTRQILLIHVNAFSAEMLDDLLRQYERAGVVFVTLEAALKDRIFDRDPPVLNEEELTFWQRVAPPDRGVELPKMPDLGLPALDRICR